MPLPGVIHRLLPRSAIALASLWALGAAANGLFVHFADVEYYVSRSERLLRLSRSADEALEQMIREGEVTWDPTNGEKMARVLGHLKETDHTKLLVVGSSQQIVVRDEPAEEGHEHVASRVLMRLSRIPIQTYNLSVGGMTAAEKSIVLERAAECADFRYVVVAVTLWDTFAGSVRPAIQSIPKASCRNRAESSGSLAAFLDPSHLNAEARQQALRVLENHAPFVRRRSAIQQWAEDVVVGRARFRRVSEAGSETHAPDAEGVQFDYGVGDRDQILIANLDRLLDTCVRLKAQSPATFAVVLTPVRQDPKAPTYLPAEFTRRFAKHLRRRCMRDGLLFLDASAILDQSHFGRYRDGEHKGKVDPLHFGQAGHRRLAEFLAVGLGLR